MSRFARTFLIALACLALVVCAFSPHLWVFAGHAPGSFEWHRAMTYLRQCAQPFDQNVEPAMRWRLLPALVAHATGLTGSAPLVIPWIGVVVLVTWVAMRLRNSLDELARRRPADAPRVATWAGILALIVPAAHIVFTKIAPIDNIVIELIRLHRFHP